MGWMDDTYAEAVAGRIPAGAKLRKDAKAQILEATPAQIIRQSRKGPNKTETRFEQEHLKPMLAAGRITDYEFEGLTLKIANGCRYTPDWIATALATTYEPSRLRIIHCYEIKARQMMWDDAIVKLKVAAAKYPGFWFHLCAWDKDGWTIQEVLP